VLNAHNSSKKIQVVTKTTLIQINATTDRIWSSRTRFQKILRHHGSNGGGFHGVDTKAGNRSPYCEGNGRNNRGSRCNADNLGIKQLGTSNYRRKRQGCSYNSDHVRMRLHDTPIPRRQTSAIGINELRALVMHVTHLPTEP